jgi:hypothetical protein
LANFSDRATPALDEFDSIDADQYSQNECFELYKEQYGDTDQSVELTQKNQSVELPSITIGEAPREKIAWHNGCQHAFVQLKVHGVLPIDNLTTFINLSGRTVSFGTKIEDRAARLMACVEVNRLSRKAAPCSQSP